MYLHAFSEKEEKEEAALNFYGRKHAFGWREQIFLA
jgi:hypothetical protein